MMAGSYLEMLNVEFFMSSQVRAFRRDAHVVTELRARERALHAVC